MQINVLEYLDNIIKETPDKIAYSDGDTSLTFSEVYNRARAIGTFLNTQGHYREPVVVFMNKSPLTVTAFFGVVYSGNYYVPIDEEMPKNRIELILQNLKPRAVICGDDIFLDFPQIYKYSEMVKTPVDDFKLSEIRSKAIDTDPIYAVFTSGSTGLPKGVIACHRSVIDYIENLSEVLGFTRETVFGNQAPLYVDACLKEIYPTLKFGATTYFIPKNLFMFPIKLINFLKQYKINTVCWVASAFMLIAGLGALEKAVPNLHTIAFGSEVFQIKHFNMWRRSLPNARFINLYGPTEATGMSCYYEVDREFSQGEVIPIGKPFKNTEIILLNEERNKTADYGETGEICIRGTALTLGYVNDFERTNQAFIQNPLNASYPELIYCTGDLGKYNERGELVFVSRKDHQIKRMGHRIELGEIEAAVNAHQEIRSACCIYDGDKNKIILFYVGAIRADGLTVYLKQKLPGFMIPNSIFNIDVMPLTPNGKIDRMALKNNYENSK